MFTLGGIHCLQTLFISVLMFKKEMILIFKFTPESIRLLRPDSSVCRASAFGEGGRGFESRPHHTKGVKTGSDARIKGVVLGR